MDAAFAAAVPHVRDPAAGKIGLALMMEPVEPSKRKVNIRLALILGAVALGFFVFALFQDWS